MATYIIAAFLVIGIVCWVEFQRIKIEFLMDRLAVLKTAMLLAGIKIPENTPPRDP
jgi:hypothetical protein